MQNVAAERIAHRQSHLSATTFTYLSYNSLFLLIGILGIQLTIEFQAFSYQLIGLQMVRTARCAYAAMYAVLDLVHLRLELRLHPRAYGRACKQLYKPRRVVKRYTHGTGHTIAATAAERAYQLLAVLFNYGQQFIV